MADENQELAEGEEENLQGEGEDAASGGDYEDVGEGEVTPYNVERKEAALKIQTAHRGARDRRRVKDAKARGDLPGQKMLRRSGSGPKRASDESKGDIQFYDGVASTYSGDLVNGRPQGHGLYTFANGNVYEGQFSNGQFHGDGELRFPGYGKYIAIFENGRAVKGKFFFEDGLQYQPQGWKYCVEGDRRFYHEVVDPRFGLADE